MAFGSEIIARLGLNTEAFVSGLSDAGSKLARWGSESTKEAKGVARSFEDLKKVFIAGGLVTAVTGFFRNAIEYAREYKGVVDENVEATRRFARVVERIKNSAAEAGVAIIGAVEKAAVGLASLVYGAEAGADAYDKMNQAEAAAIDDERVRKLTEAKQQLAKVNRDIAFSEAAPNERLVILLNEQVDLRQKIREAGVETVEGVRLQGELAKKESEVRKLNREIAEAETKSATEKKEQEEATNRALEEQMRKRADLIESIKREQAEIEKKVAAETVATIRSANAAAAAQGFETLSPQEERAVRDWIAAGKRDASGNSVPAPVNRSGPLRDALGSAALDQTVLFVDGKAYNAAARSQRDFQGASREALDEFIRRREAEAAELERNFATGPDAAVEVASGGYVRALVASMLKTEIGRARYRIGQIDQFDGVDRASALRNFKGDLLVFDRLYDAAQRTQDSSNRTALAVEEMTRMFRSGQATARTFPINTLGTGG